MHLDAWTLALQTVNVLVLVWLLARFLFRPVAALIAERRAAAEKLLDDAAAAKQQADAAAAEMAARRRDFAAEGERLLAEARDAAEAERARLLGLAQAEAEALRSAARTGAAREEAALRRALEAAARRLALAIAARLLARLPAGTTTPALLHSLAADLAALPDEARNGLADASVPVEVVSAAPLAEAERATCAAMLAEATGRAPSLSFRTDPTLIAGIELYGAHTAVRSSWRADLDRIGQEFSLDDEHV